MSILNHFNGYYSRRITEIREELKTLYRNPDTKIIIEAGHYSCLQELLLNLPTLEDCTQRQYRCYRVLMSRLKADLDDLAAQHRREIIDHYNLAFRQIWNYYDPDHALLVMLDDTIGKVTIVHPREPNIKHIFPYSNAGVVAAADTMAMLKERIDCSKISASCIHLKLTEMHNDATNSSTSQRAIDIFLEQSAAEVLKNTSKQRQQ